MAVVVGCSGDTDSHRREDAGLDLGERQVFTSALADSSFLCDCSTHQASESHALGMDVHVMLDVDRQVFYGFGTCMSDGNAAAAMRLSPERRREAVRMLFSTDGGNGYVFCRVPMGSNDFSTCDYTCVETGDTTLRSFNIGQDRKNILPILKLAQESCPTLRFMVSPWSPPAYTKTNGERLHGGKLKTEYRGQWADCFAKFIKAYAAEGLATEFVTIQNEPQAVQSWESCIWTGEEEGEFAVDFLRPRLDEIGLQQVKILCWDHNRDQFAGRARASFGVAGTESALAGIAHHWYGGDHFEQLDAFHHIHPDKLLVESEFCTGPNKGRTTMPYGVWGDLELYAHEIIGCLNHFTNVIFDFNAFLDTHAGPYHNRGNGGIPSMVIDGETGTFTPQPHYYAMAHFSRFIRPGAHIVSAKSSVGSVEVTAAKNPDDSVVCVVSNGTGTDRKARLYISGRKTRGDILLPAHSLTTVVVDT